MPFSMTTSLLVTGQMTQMLPGLLGLEDEPGGKDVSEWPPETSALDLAIKTQSGADEPAQSG